MSEKKKYYLGFDAGTQSVKVAVYDEEMKCVAQHVNATSLRYPQPGWVEMDADGYLEATAKGMRQCSAEMKEKGLDPAGVRSIFGDGIILGITGVNKEGRSITPYINYLDSRTKEDAEKMAEQPRSIWARETGNPEPSCMFPAMFARWFMKNSRSFQQEGCKFMHNAPYVLSRLAGLAAEDAFIDWGTLSGWGLGYDVIRKEWSQEQLDILEIPREYLPRIVKPWDIIGHLTKEWAEKTGFAEGTPICAGAGDTMQSMIGCGVTEVNSAADVAGTCAMFCIATDGIKPELSKPGMNLIFNSGTLENTYFYWGFIRTGGLALRWFRDNICKRTGDGSYFDVLNEEAEHIPAGCSGVLFLPYLTGGVGELSEATGGFLNMTMDTDQAVLWRAVLEAIGYDYIGVTDIYRKAGLSLDRITVTEGGSRSALWNQIKADMMDSRVVTLKTAEGAVMTDAAAAAYAVGDVEDLKEVFRKNLDIRRGFSPRREKTEFYRNMYELRKSLMTDHMKQVFSVLHKMEENTKAERNEINE